MLTLDEIEFETPDEATLTLDDVQFDSQAAQTPARRPTSQSRKRLRTKIPGGKVTAEDLKVRVPRTQLLDRVLQGEELDIQGGDPVTTISNTPASFDFQQPITELTTSTTPVRITPGRPRKQPDESVEAFVRRSKEFEDKQAQVEQRRKALRAQTRAKTLPSQGLEKYPTAMAQGVEGVLRPAIVMAAEWAGVEPPEWAKQENILPRLGEADATEWGTKVATGVGSIIPQVLLSIATGGAGTIVLGALSNAGQTYEEAKAMGASDQDALAASVTGALIGSLEGVLGLGSGQLAGQLAKGTIKTFAGDVTKELFQELTNQALNNVNAKYVSGYDPQRSLTEGLWDTFTTTLPIAGGFNVGQLANGGLKRSGVEFSVGPLEQEKLGTTLYSGLDPSLIREYLPRPETLRNLFSQLFSSKQVGTLPEVSLKLSQLSNKLTSEASEKFTRTREEALNRFKSVFPESPDDWTVNQYQTVLEEHWPAIKEHIDRYSLDEIFSPNTYHGDDVYPPENNYTVSYNYIPSPTEPGKFAIETVAKDSEDNTIATVISPGMYPSVRLDLATQIVKHDLVNRSLGKPFSNQTQVFLEKLKLIRDREQFKLEQKLDQDYRKITKHIYRWLDKQKYEMNKQANSSQLNVKPLESQVTSDPQGIVIHKISHYNLENLLEKANYDLTKAKQPSPSIGIIHPETDFDSFGDIQLIATPSLVDETVRSGTAYPTDFDTPTVTEIFNLNQEGLEFITPENADAISKSMVDQMRNYAETRLDNPEEIFDKNILFSSYAKAGGAWESKQELIKGLATLKAATVRSAIPEFHEINQIKASFTHKKQRVYDQLREVLEPSLSQSIIAEPRSKESQRKWKPIKKTLDKYLLTQLSKKIFPSAEAFTTGLRNALIRFHPELEAALGEDADPNSELIRVLEEFTPTALATFQAFRDVPSEYMEIQPTRPIQLNEYVAALLPLDEGTATIYQKIADTLTNLGLKVYRYSNPEEKIAIQKALAQFKDLTVNPDSSYGALYSNPIFNPDLWKSLLKVFRKEEDSINLADYEHVPDLAAQTLPLFAERKDPNTQSSTKFSQPSARFYPGSASKGGTVYVNPQMASKFEDLPLSAGAFNLETKEFGKLVAKLPKDDPATQPLVEAFREAITKKLPSVNVVIHYEGSGPWARRLARHESFHRGQYLASQELLRSKGREHLFEPDIGTIHDPSLHDHPVVLKVESTLIGERIKSRYPDNYAKAALTFETAAYMASNDYKRFGVSPEDAANFVTDYLQSVAETAGVSGLSALIEGTRLSPSVEKIGKDILNASSIRDTRSPSRYLPGTASRTVAQLAESEDSPGRDPATGLPENVESTTTTELFEPVLRPEVVAESARRFRQLITDSGLQYDPKLPAHLNLAKAIGEGKLNLESLGLTPDDYAVFAKDLAQSASEYGRGLQAVGQTQVFYERLVKENPEQAKRLAEAGLSPQIARAALRTLRATQYGQSLWERMGALPRKMALTRLSTFWTNVWGTLGFLPLTILDGAITGLGLQALDPKRYSQDSELSLAQKATKRIKEGMRPATNVLLAMTPKSLGAVLNRSTGMEKFDQVANELELLHPDIYTKLHGVEHSTLKQETADVTVSLLREVLPLMPDGKERLEVEQKFKEIDRHQRFNKSLAGKAYGKTEWAYDYLLRPMTWQEYAFRRPFFVGALQRELAQEGLDLWDLVASGNLSAASRPAIEKAVDAALEFTWSYMPHERDHGVIEASTNTLIKSINKLGPVGFLVEAFPRAIYNGLKFWYEWGPWGGVTPAIKTISNLSKSRRDAIAYRDIQRISRAALGTILYGAALSLRSSAGGEEWWQLATGRKDSKGRPIYYNAKRIPQLAFFLWAADSAQRVAEQRDVDKKFQQEGLELYASMRRTGSTEQLGAVDAFLDWWQEKDNSESAARGLARPAGQLLALPLTPFINVRDVWGQFSTDEAARKDLRDEPLTAPALDRLPWFRRRLPNFQSPTETGITPTSNDPLTTVAPGIVFDPGTSFAGREFARLGITPYHWLKRDASPKIDRAQFAMYSKILESIGESLSQDPSYLQASDLEKAARWEALLAGPEGIAAIAREAGLAADPNEATKRELRKAVPPLRRRANPALNDKIKSIGK